MDKRLILAIALCAGILFAWTKLFPPPAPAPTPAKTEVTSDGKTEGKTEGNSEGKSADGTTPAGAAPSPGVPGAASAIPAGGTFPEQQTIIETPAQRFVFSNRGATLRHARLREKGYLLKANDPDSGPDLVRVEDPQLAPLRLSFPDSTFAAPPDAAWQLVRTGPTPAGDEVVYAAVSGGARIEKRFVVDKTRYRVHLDVTVENLGATPTNHHLGIALAGHQDQEAKGGFFSGAAGNTSSMLCHIDEKTDRHPVEKLQKDPFDKVGAVSWIGSDEKFFLTAVVPYPETPPKGRTCWGKSASADAATVGLSFAERPLAPGQKTAYAFTVFVGPKVIADLDEVRPGGVDVKLNEAVDVSLAVLSRPMLFMLKLFQRFVGNWGVAIIMLTIFIRLLTFYPTQRSLMSAKKMQKLGPKMAAIRKKYEYDRQRQSAETMNLYKAHGVSPFGGCLPSLIQMPIWIALYSTLNYAVELYRAPFIFHIHDLTAKDPYYITPLLMGGVMFVQMKMSPTSPDNQQQAMMALMMPVMFTAFSLVLPSGLAVYMLTSYLIGILQQLWVNHLDRKANGPAPVPAKA